MLRLNPTPQIELPTAGARERFATPQEAAAMLVPLADVERGFRRLKRATRLELVTSSLGNASSTAWLSRFRTAEPNSCRWNPLETAAAAHGLARNSRALLGR